ncbi:hypothetical protein CJF42_10180 [Pseudoalteromonas sp. NBT06-2]|uniref:polysaccharide deacetylase family protein n=1 Tax=Pseudoalteromonas sp. NBT06-2 TaxID=2025950 RepID=UPI000BA7108B|nr:polysaccharide deacetylase family protein [Pseudoalteromonas sp. NBT06-2]PAJ74471.1 hypothetical protein CJF42_10180 [Pseudoalteromonas sp. NBT06-2]
MSLLIKVPEYSGEELNYVLEVVFKHFLQIEFEVTQHCFDSIEVCEKGSGNTIRFKDSFYKLLSLHGYNKEILPTYKNEYIDLSSIDNDFSCKFFDLPIFYGTANCNLGSHTEVSFDFFGTIFFLLSRIEEVIQPVLDKHNRFIGQHSYLNKRGLLQRPLVDEYIHFLKYLLKMCLSLDWYGKKEEPKIEVSCDVDHPFYRTGGSVTRYIKAFAADILIRKQPKLAAFRLLNLVFSPFKNYTFDPYYTFDWYLSKLKKYKIKGSFYFICDNTSGSIDGYYSINEKALDKLIKGIFNDGHRIGVHGSYNSINSQSQIKKEKVIFQDVLEKLNIKIGNIGSRQHYLRWDNTSTSDYLNSAGYEYDSSGGYADLSGFKFGTARSFPMWSLKNKKKLALLQKPIIIMDASLLSVEYMNLGYAESTRKFIKELFDSTHYYGGVFRILWHNSHLLTSSDRELLEYIMQLKGPYEN